MVFRNSLKEKHRATDKQDYNLYLELEGIEPQDVFYVCWQGCQQFLNYDFDDVGENNSYLDTNEDDGNESNIGPSESLDQKNVLEENGSEEDGDEAEEIADNKTGSSTDSVNNIGISQQPEEMLSIIDNEDLKHKSVVYL